MSADASAAVGVAAADGVEEGAIVLDRHGRPCGVTAGLQYGFRSTAGALRGDVAALVDDCVAAFSARAVDDHAAYSSGRTFFVAADGDGDGGGGGDAPRCELERLALAVFDAHTRDAVGVDRRRSGAEWWTQVIDAHDDIAFHYDRDYALEHDYGVNVHPHLATVTYLGDIGAPTVVLERAAGAVDADDYDDEERGAGRGEAVPRAFISLPRARKHISFDGRWLHAAPAELSRPPLATPIRAGASTEAAGELADDGEGEGRSAKRARHRRDDSSPRPATAAAAAAAAAATTTTTTKRVTFLVNVWINYRPRHVSRLSSRRAATMRAALRSCELSLSDGGGGAARSGVRVLTLDKSVLNHDAAESFDFDFVEAHRSMCVHLRLSDEVTAAAADVDAVQVDFAAPECCRVLVGERLPSSSSFEESESGGDDDEDDEEEGEDQAENA